jgi:hypothetical protein
VTWHSGEKMEELFHDRQYTCIHIYIYVYTEYTLYIYYNIHIYIFIYLSDPNSIGVEKCWQDHHIPQTLAWNTTYNSHRSMKLITSLPPPWPRWIRADSRWKKWWLFRTCEEDQANKRTTKPNSCFLRSWISRTNFRPWLRQIYQLLHYLAPRFFGHLVI